ncbi:MAG: crotonase/enoyl-CoA hydratase family protein [Pseudomonadales bacterium]|nr:crotonase/enoyl-CoA hydratase family protein [Pseudomonadales bacterium]
MSYNTIQVTIDDRGVATLLLNRPEKHNAMNDELIREVTEAARELDSDSKVRCVVLTGAGESFCAGGDLKWMQGIFAASRAERVDDSAKLAAMLRTLNELSKPLIGKINGQAYGGGTGMISVCDIAIAAESCRFALTETRLGLTPANISTFVVEKMGRSNARRTFLNARPLTAAKAKDVCLVDEVVADEELDTAVEKEIGYVLQCGPGAIAVTKKLIFFVDSHDTDTCVHYTANILADTWESEEGQEGIHCFFNKETPSWRQS